MKEKILGVFIVLIFSSLLFLRAMENKTYASPMEAYQVYLNGNLIGTIEQKEKLYSLINNKQTEIKNKYNVDKVYPPHGLDIKKVYTYNNEIVDPITIYNEIKDVDPFTIEAYHVTIKYNSDKMADEEAEDEVVVRNDANLYLMDKSILYESLYNTAAAFVSTEELEKFEKGTQVEIDETGEKITSVLFDETISVKKELVSVEKNIFENVDDLSRYLLFGTLEEQQSYVIQDGEDLKTIAENHKLNVEELLIANPEYPSANVLLAAGNTLNVGLINPLVSVVYKKTIVEDMEVQYKEEVENDNTKPYSYTMVKQEGSNGVSRVTQNVTYVNGEVKSFDIVSQEELKPAVNKIVVKGTLGNTGNYTVAPTTGKWAWPTLVPFKIVSPFKWRWGRMHQGIDISGPGYGSPIFATGSGVVYHINRNTSKAEGLSVRIDHGNGLTTIYMHLSKVKVNEGDTVEKGQLIANMGCTGRCYGVHLHLGVYEGHPYEGGTPLDPCKTMFSC